MATVEGRVPSSTAAITVAARAAAAVAGTEAREPRCWDRPQHCERVKPARELKQRQSALLCWWGCYARAHFGLPSDVSPRLDGAFRGVASRARRYHWAEEQHKRVARGRAVFVVVLAAANGGESFGPQSERRGPARSAQAHLISDMKIYECVLHSAYSVQSVIRE